MRVIFLLLSIFCLIDLRGQTDDRSLFEKLVYFENQAIADSLFLYLDSINNESFTDQQLLAYKGYFNYFNKSFNTDAKDSLLRVVVQNARNIQDDVLEAKASLRLGRLMRRGQNTDSVAYYYLSALRAIEKQSEEETLGYKNDVWAEVLYTLSSFYHRNSRYEKGIAYGLKAIEKASLTDNDYLKLSSHVNLSAIYGELASEDNVLGTSLDRDRYRKLLNEHSLEALTYASRLPDESASGWAYFNYATFLTEDKQWSEAFHYIKQAVKIFDDKAYANGQSLAYDLMGNYFRNDNSIDSAFYYFDRASEFAQESGSKNIIAETQLNFGYLFLSIGDTTRAIKLFKDVTHLAEANALFREALQANQALALIYEEQQKKGKALDHYKRFSAFQDSAVSEKNYLQIEKLRSIYETDKKEVSIRELTTQNQIQELQLSQRNLLLWIGLSVFVFLFIIGYLIYNQRLVHRRKEANDLKQKLLRVQLNPHFMFNSLNAIQNMIFRSVDKHRTADYLARFSHLTRQILELNQRDFIILKDELKFIENYLSIQQIRFDEPFGYSISIDDEVEADSTMIPPMITQPFLENAIEHGIINKKDKGNIRLIVTTDDTHLHLKIEDNGVGREKAAFAKKVESHRSLATEITQDRLANLTKSFRKEAFMTIEDIFEGELVCGTRVHFTLPLNFTNT